MPSETTVEERHATGGIAVRDPADGVIYLLPSASIGDGRPAYMGGDPMLLKQALAAGVAAEYALPEDERVFVDYFSAATDIIGLSIAVVGLVPSTIQGIHAFIELAVLRRGYKGEAARRAKVSLEIDFIKTPSTEARGLRIKGDAEGVAEAVRSLGLGS